MYVYIYICMYICDLIIQSTSNQSNSRWRAWNISVAIRFCYEVQEVVPKTYLGLFEHIMSITNSNGLLLSPVKWSWSEGITWYNGVYPTFSQRLRLDHSSTGVFIDGHVVELAAVESLHTLEESWTTQLSWRYMNGDSWSTNGDWQALISSNMLCFLSGQFCNSRISFF